MTTPPSMVPQQSAPSGAEPVALDIPTAARSLGIGRSKFYELINSGAIRSFTLGRRRLVTPEALRDFVRTLDT